MSKVLIIYSQYLDKYGEKHMIGGVETYIKNLIPVCKDAGYTVHIYQKSNIQFSRDIDGAQVLGVQVKNKNIKKELVAAASCNANFDKDILIFATDFQIVKNSFKKSIAIQHGIAWDISTSVPINNLSNIFSIVKSSLRTFVKYNRYKNCKSLVCVDYNFVNWYRTQVAYVNTNLQVITNFTRIPYKNMRDKGEYVSIIFARRFVEYRGTSLFVEAICYLLERYDNLKITIAGEGPDEEWIRKKLGQYQNVNIIHFEADESIKIHQQYDIAVVPSLGSEGTSLSLLEAMASGCAVIATYVGGMSNIILNEYNGVLIEPTVSSLTVALEKLIIDYDFRIKIAENGYETVKKAFSLERWKKEWFTVLKNL